MKINLDTLIKAKVKAFLSDFEKDGKVNWKDNDNIKRMLTDSFQVGFLSCIESVRAKEIVFKDAAEETKIHS